MIVLKGKKLNPDSIHGIRGFMMIYKGLATFTVAYKELTLKSWLSHMSAALRVLWRALLPPPAVASLSPLAYASTMPLPPCMRRALKCHVGLQDEAATPRHLCLLFLHMSRTPSKLFTGSLATRASTRHLCYSPRAPPHRHRRCSVSAASLHEAIL
jgi:hypothetical protein